MTKHASSHYAETELIRYADGICKKMKGKPGEINDFREEMLDHLRTSVKGMQAVGYSEESAIREALVRFGEPSYVE